jgi:hypothetical protein
MSLARIIGAAVELRPHRSRGTRVPAFPLDRRQRTLPPSRGHRVHTPGARGVRHRAICHALVPARLVLGAQ